LWLSSAIQLGYDRTLSSPNRANASALRRLRLTARTCRSVVEEGGRVSLAARAGARQVECRPSHRDTSASFGVPLFRRQRRDECKYEGQPVSLHPLDDNFFIHREYTTPPSSVSPPAGKHSTIGAATERPSRPAAANGRYGVPPSRPRRPSPARFNGTIAVRD